MLVANRGQGQAYATSLWARSYSLSAHQAAASPVRMVMPTTPSTAFTAMVLTRPRPVQSSPAHPHRAPQLRRSS